MRPLIHLTAPSGWINDPHAITVRDGVHHLFHQYVPDSLVHDPACRWGHAVSPDLVHWEHRPVAIEPGDGDDGIWTGSLAQADDGPVILYTSVRSADYGMGRVRRAVPVDDRWDQWVKEEIVAQAPEDLDLIAYRDPFVMREKDGWRFFIGAGSRDGHAMALTYTSRNLHEWTYDGVAAERATTQTEPVWTGRLWECPQFVDVDGIWAMISSVWDDDVLHYAAYGLGRYDGGRFSATSWGRLSHGNSYYAPSVFRDAEGRPSLMFWMREVMDAEQGWAGCLSVPHRLVATDDGRLGTILHPQIRRRFGPGDPSDAARRPVLLSWRPSNGSVLHLGEGARLNRHGKVLTLRLGSGAPRSMPFREGRSRSFSTVLRWRCSARGTSSGRRSLQSTASESRAGASPLRPTRGASTNEFPGLTGRRANPPPAPHASNRSRVGPHGRPCALGGDRPRPSCVRHRKRAGRGVGSECDVGSDATDPHRTSMRSENQETSI